METVLHTYSFNIDDPDQLAQWIALQIRLAASNGPVFDAMAMSGDKSKSCPGGPVELDTKCVFNNQWNTASGFRVFDWYQGIVPNKSIKKGHYLDMTPEMVGIRLDTAKCGYCGHFAPTDTGPEFCPACIGSRYLEKSNLKLTRMRAIAQDRESFPELSASELETLLPLYNAAQKSAALVRLEQRKEDALADRQKKIDHAETEYAAIQWLIQNDLFSYVDNMIFYGHTQRFCFGWRNSLTADQRSELLDILCEFPFDYDLK